VLGRYTTPPTGRILPAPRDSVKLLRATETNLTFAQRTASPKGETRALSPPRP